MRDAIYFASTSAPVSITFTSREVDPTAVMCWRECQTCGHQTFAKYDAATGKCRTAVFDTCKCGTLPVFPTSIPPA